MYDMMCYIQIIYPGPHSLLTPFKQFLKCEELADNNSLAKLGSVQSFDYSNDQRVKAALGFCPNEVNK